MLWYNTACVIETLNIIYYSVFPALDDWSMLLSNFYAELYFG